MWKFLTVRRKLDRCTLGACMTRSRECARITNKNVDAAPTTLPTMPPHQLAPSGQYKRPSSQQRKIVIQIHSTPPHQHKKPEKHTTHEHCSPIVPPQSQSAKHNGLSVVYVAFQQHKSTSILDKNLIGLLSAAQPKVHRLQVRSGDGRPG